ncbi:MAG: hypothetical protein MOGMAGMI_02180 [Candidatus Omnitrophica bacterium]|nr:hypothetical protein [Candidatus Omnitrophota bacterium]
MARTATPSLGVDLVELPRARRFVREHASRLNGYFHPSEIRILNEHRDPARGAAVVLAAKESVFKATPGSVWMGVDGFRRVRVSRASDGSLRAASTDGRRWRLWARLTPRYALAVCTAEGRKDGSCAGI